MLVVCSVAIFFAFLFSRSLGCCKRCGCQRCVELFDSPPPVFASDETARGANNTEVELARMSRTGACADNAEDETEMFVQTNIVSEGNPMHSAKSRSQLEVTYAGINATMGGVNPMSRTRRLPSGWTQHRTSSDDQFSNQLYYVHAAADVTQWTFPTDEDHSAALAIVAKRAASATAMDSSSTVDISPHQQAPSLPSGWSSVEDAASGQVYYGNKSTGESSWEVPTALPRGWEALVHAESGRAYYHHRESGHTRWDKPSTNRLAATDGGRAAAAGVTSSSTQSEESEEVEEKPGRIVSLVARKSSGQTSRQKHLMSEHARLRALRRARKKIRWKWRPQQQAASLADSLFGESTSLGFLTEICGELFAEADLNRDNVLSTLEILKLLQHRAKGSALERDAHAMFAFKQTLHAQADHEDVTRHEWEHGIIAAMRADPNGAVAQWIFRELQDRSFEWTACEHEGATYYVHATKGKVWEMPLLVAAMNRFNEYRTKNGGAVQSGTSSTSTSTSSSDGESSSNSGV